MFRYNYILLSGYFQAQSLAWDIRRRKEEGTERKASELARGATGCENAWQRRPRFRSFESQLFEAGRSQRAALGKFVPFRLKACSGTRLQTWFCAFSAASRRRCITLVRKSLNRCMFDYYELNHFRIPSVSFLQEARSSTSPSMIWPASRYGPGWHESGLCHLLARKDKYFKS